MSYANLSFCHLSSVIKMTKPGFETWLSLYVPVVIHNPDYSSIFWTHCFFLIMSKLFFCECFHDKYADEVSLMYNTLQINYKKVHDTMSRFTFRHLAHVPESVFE